MRVIEDIHAAIRRAMLRTQKPRVSGVVAIGMEIDRASVVAKIKSWSIYRSKCLASSLEVKDLCAGITLTYIIKVMSLISRLKYKGRVKLHLRSVSIKLLFRSQCGAPVRTDKQLDVGSRHLRR